MCLIAWNWQPASPTPLLLIANRDEHHARPTAALHWWDDADILAGRDLRSGGSWLGVSRNGRLAALTNHRNPGLQRVDRPSRGELVSNFLRSGQSALEFLTELRRHSADYNPFNLLLFDGSSLLGLESRHDRLVRLLPGLGAVSNADFHTPWPKLTRLRQALQRLLDQDRAGNAELLTLLHDVQLANDADLPASGIPLALERALSAAFVITPDYGTRSSSVVRIGNSGIEFLEQGFDASGSAAVRQLMILPIRVQN